MGMAIGTSLRVAADVAGGAPVARSLGAAIGTAIGEAVGTFIGAAMVRL